MALILIIIVVIDYMLGGKGVRVKECNFSLTTRVFFYDMLAFPISNFTLLDNEGVRAFVCYSTKSSTSSISGLVKNNTFENAHIQVDLNTSSSDTLGVSNNDINLSSNASFQCHKDDNYIVLRRNNFNGQSQSHKLYVERIDTVTGNRFVNFSDVSEGILEIWVSNDNNKSCYVFNNYFQTQGSLAQKAIRVWGSGSHPLFLVNNSIESTANSAVSSYGIYIEADVPLTVKNNIISGKNGGVQLYVGVPLTNIDWDYNCYYTTGNVIANYNGTNYSSVSVLGAAMGSDANSLNVNPFFVSDTNLTANQGQLQVGISIAGVTTDIDGTVREKSTHYWC